MVGSPWAKEMGIPHKIILIQGYFYEGHAVARQLEFMDRFLHDKDNNVKNWPKVRLEVRERYFSGKFINFPDFQCPIQSTFLST